MQNRIARARGAAVRLLLSQNLKSLFIDVAKLRYDRPIVFASMQEFCAQTRMTMDALLQDAGTRDGLTIIRQQRSGMQYTVLYNNAVSPRRTSFTLAHEVGHIYLGHTGDDDAQENEANVFASQLLLPDVLLYELSRQADPLVLGGVVYETFNISRYAAEYRLHKLRKTVLAPDFSRQELALLRKYGCLLPRINEPLVTLR